MKLGPMPTVSRVLPKSDAWAAGILEGDGILRVGGQATVGTPGMSRGSMMPLLESRAKLTIWRRPLGMDLMSPWTVVMAGSAQ